MASTTSSIVRRVMQNASLTIGVNFGIVNLATTLNMTPNEMIDVAKVARSGTSSVLNVQGDADLLHRVLEALVDADKFSLVGCKDVIQKVDDLEHHATMLRSDGFLSAVPFSVAGLPKDVKIMLSVALSIGAVAGLDVAVIVVRRLIRSLQDKRHTSSDQLVDDAHVDSAVRDLYNNLKSGGHTASLEQQCALYDDISCTSGWYGHRYRNNITEALVCLTEWAFACTVNTADSAKAKRPWATHSAKVHKACFILEKMGWKVRTAFAAAENMISTSASDCGNCLFLESGTSLGLDIMELVKVEGNAPTRLRGNGGGVTVPLQKITALVGAALSFDTHTQASVEAAWELGESKGKLCKVVRGVYEDQCTYRLSHPRFEARLEAPNCKWAARMLVKVGSKASEFAKDFHDICRATHVEYDKLRNSAVEDWHLESPTVCITLAYLIGFIYGEVYRLATDIEVLQECFDKVFISWLDSPLEFLELMLATLIPAENEDALPFTEVCRVIAASYCGDAMSVLAGGEERDCVGLWTRRGLLLMRGVLDPTPDFWHCSNTMLLPDWPLNLVGRDIYVISANKCFESDSGFGHFHVEPEQFKPTVEVTRPSTRMSIGCSPNLSDYAHGTNMHCMFADGHLIYCGPIMATIASLHDAVAPCVCGGDPQRSNTCTGRNDMFVVTDRDLMEERMYVSKTYKTLTERTIDYEQPPEELQTDSKGVVLVHNDRKWAYAAASVYIRSGIVLAGSCLSCAVDKTQHIVIQCGDSLLSHAAREDDDVHT